MDLEMQHTGCLLYTSLKKGYEKYLCQNGIEVETKIAEKDIFKFNYQGQIREIFEDENLCILSDF